MEDAVYALVDLVENYLPTERWNTLAERTEWFRDAGLSATLRFYCYAIALPGKLQSEKEHVLVVIKTIVQVDGEYAASNMIAEFHADLATAGAFAELQYSSSKAEAEKLLQTAIGDCKKDLLKEDLDY